MSPSTPPPPAAPPSSGNLVLLASSLSVVVACVMVVMKGITLYFSGSQSILASLADSGLDLLASLITFAAVRYAKAPPDKEHPFGHGKAEAFSALVQAGLVFASAALIMQSCVEHLKNPEPVTQSSLAIGVLIVSIILTIGLVFFQNLALKSSQSVAISADRMHYVTDLVSNSIALIGVVAAALGFVQMDAIAGFVMAAWFVWGALKVLREAADHLMDRGLEDGDVARIIDLIAQDPQVLGVHQLRTRLMGPYILIQAHVEMSPTLSLDAAHKIIIGAEKRLLDVFPNADILIHADPQGLAEPHGGVFGEEAPTGFDLSAPNKA
ncbi:cation diffusion facilitator family transporter [Asticcacaulis sp. 201]|uniref:cation diffusion facilitator family transporter n=1 Tax=Asticcacaulis sp. 201 TaxID=3028787 RepID=UPI002915F7DF|nr:cation diffusion facilitator family transporter [Asticcacaulis sp. 201]MDV6332113.1 cation diffusion facilitator family transporter [Asticcacaulis sp. 201]